MTLALALFIAITGTSNNPDESAECKREKVISLVNKYVEDIPKRPESTQSVSPSGKVVLLTGGTGSFGSNILAWLLKSDDISMIYALSRASSTTSNSKDRHVQAFQREDLPIDILDSKVHFLDGDLAADSFGLTKERFDEVRSPWIAPPTTDAIRTQTHSLASSSGYPYHP